MRRGVWTLSVPWILAITGIALLGCGGGDGGGPQPPPPTATIQGSVSGTIIVAVDESGNIAARDDTAGKTPIDNTVPPKYPFTMEVDKNHAYHLFFIVDEGMPSQRIVPLYFGTTNVFSVGTASSVDLGFVNTSGAQATAAKDPFSVPGVTPGPGTGPNTIRLEGFKFFILIDNWDSRKRYRAQAQVKDAAGNTLTDGSLVKGMKVYSPTRAELPQDGNFFLFNGSNSYYDGGGGIVPLSQSDLETYLVAAPGSLSYGFYTVLVTDNNGNLYTTTMYHGTPAEVSKPTALSQTINVDNSITLSWTNPAGISSPTYQVYVDVVCDDGNGDGQIDFLLYANVVSMDNSYTIPAGFAQTTLAGKTGLKWMAEIRQQTTTPVTFPDGTSSNVPLYRVRSPQTVLTLQQSTLGFTPAMLSGKVFFEEVNDVNGSLASLFYFNSDSTYRNDSWDIPPDIGETTTGSWAINPSGELVVNVTGQGAVTVTLLSDSSTQMQVSVAQPGSTSVEILEKTIPVVSSKLAGTYDADFGDVVTFNSNGTGNDSLFGDFTWSVDRAGKLTINWVIGGSKTEAYAFASSQSTDTSYTVLRTGAKDSSSTGVLEFVYSWMFTRRP